MEPHRTLIQITDLHLVTADSPPRYGIDTFAVLERALRAVEDAQVRPAALVFTGDLAEHGDPAEYRRLRELVEPAAERIGAPAVYAAGNHDDRAALREHLLGLDGSDDPLDHVLRVGDLRIVVLDSTVPGRAHGELRAEQLAWLRAELASTAPVGTVLALHHPPLPSPSRLTRAMELQRRDELASVIRGTDVRVVLAGHTHVVSAGTLAGMPVWTGGAATFMFDGLPPAHGTRGLRMPTVSRIDLFDPSGADGAVLATSVPLGADRVFSVEASDVDTRVEEMLRSRRCCAS